MRWRLEDPDLGVLDLAASGALVTEFNVGFPAARAAVTDRVNTHGTDDYTAFYGARVVSMTIGVAHDGATFSRPLLERLRAFTSPSRRPMLFFNDDAIRDGEPDRMLRLRGDQYGAPLTNPFQTQVQVQWVAPEGIIESAAEQSVTVAAVPEAEAGRSYPRTYPITYPEISAVGSVGVVNEGTEPAAPLLRLWGPCTDPMLVNLTTGEQLTLTGVALTAEQYAEVDVREATVRLQGRPDQNLYTALSLSSALWWLQPGENRIRYSPATYGPTARATISWRHAWL